jgi:hypothetical protein
MSLIASPNTWSLFKPRDVKLINLAQLGALVDIGLLTRLATDLRLPIL